MLERLVGRVFPEQQKAFVGVKVDLREQRRSLRIGKGAGRAAAEALKAHDSGDDQLLERSELNFTRLKHLGATEDEALYGIFQEVPVVLLEGTDLDNSSQELQSNQWCRRRLDGCGHKAVAADLEAKLPPAFKSSGVICVGFGRGVWLMSTYATMFPQNCGFIVWVGSPNEVFDVTFGIWVLAIHPYTDLAASATSVSSDRRQQVACDADALCYSSEMIKWTGPDITDASRIAMAACVGAKPDAMINLNTGMISLASRFRLPLWMWCLLLRYGSCIFSWSTK
eukprot:s2982_g2.t1